MTKNKLNDLNDHLFMALERLNDEDMSDQQIEMEAKRAEAIVKIADQVTENAKTRILAAKIYAEHGPGVLSLLPQIGHDKSDTSRKEIDG